MKSERLIGKNKKKGMVKYKNGAPKDSIFVIITI